MFRQASEDTKGTTLAAVHLESCNKLRLTFQAEKVLKHHLGIITLLCVYSLGEKSFLNAPSGSWKGGPSLFELVAKEQQG